VHIIIPKSNSYLATNIYHTKAMFEIQAESLSSLDRYISVQTYIYLEKFDFLFYTQIDFSPHIKLSLSSWVTLPALSEFKLFCHLEYDSYLGRTCWILEDLRKYTADKSLRTVTLSCLRLLLYFAGYPQFMSLSVHQKISSSSLIYLILIFDLFDDYILTCLLFR
jgi:hypothetical protein